MCLVPSSDPARQAWVSVSQTRNLWAGGRVGALPQGPGLHYLPASGRPPRVGRGSTLRRWGQLGWGPLTGEAAASDQAGKGSSRYSALGEHPLSAHDLAGALGASCSTSPAALAQVLCQVPQRPPGGGSPPASGGRPRLRNRLEGQVGRWSPSLWQTCGPGTRGSKASDLFSGLRLWFGEPSAGATTLCSSPRQSPCGSSSSPDPVLGLKVNPACCLFPPPRPRRSASSLRVFMSFI